MFWLLSRIDASHEDPEAKEPASKQHWSQRGRAGPAPPICHIEPDPCSVPQSSGSDYGMCRADSENVC